MHDEIKAEFIAIFDADFLPEPGFLMRAIPFFQDKKVGLLDIPRPDPDPSPSPNPNPNPNLALDLDLDRTLTLALTLTLYPSTPLPLYPSTPNQVGFVQGRWTYLNADESLFCRYQEICLNAHIKCEQYARFSTGNFFNFNGTGGVWRKACIDDAGGWNARALVEDMVKSS